MRFVAVKSEAQLAMQSLHRHRSRLVANSTQLVNQARAFLLERGIAVPQGKRKFAERLPEILEDADNGLPDAARQLPEDWQRRWRRRPVLLETFVDPQRFRGTGHSATGMRIPSNSPMLRGNASHNWRRILSRCKTI